MNVSEALSAISLVPGRYKDFTNNLIEKYHYLVHVVGDPRVENWFLIYSPIPTLIYIALYLTLIYKILPNYMQDRKPFNLANIIRCYNLFQIIACSALVYNLVTPLSEPSYVWKCEHFKYSQDSVSLKRLNLSFYFYLVKAIELVETVFFMLRKKFNQVSTLHVYHHVTTFMMAWIYAKYFSGGMVAFCMTLNSFVHIIMYTYYLFASLGPHWQKNSLKFKPAITTFQMVQLFILIAHSSQVLVNKECGMPKVAFYLYAPNVAIMFYMFRNFYKRNYLNKRKMF